MNGREKNFVSFADPLDCKGSERRGQWGRRERRNCCFSFLVIVQYSLRTISERNEAEIVTFKPKVKPKLWLGLVSPWPFNSFSKISPSFGNSSKSLFRYIQLLLSSAPSFVGGLSKGMRKRNQDDRETTQ